LALIMQIYHNAWFIERHIYVVLDFRKTWHDLNVCDENSLSLAQTWYQAYRNSFVKSKECALGSEHCLVTGMIKPCNAWRYIRMYHHLSVRQLPLIVFASILCHMGTTHW